MSAKKKYNPIDYQLSVAKNMISDLQSFIQKYQGKAYMLGDSVYFESSGLSVFAAKDDSGWHSTN